MGMHGARYLHVLVPCPLGWGSASDDSDRTRAPGHGDRPVPGVRGRGRRGHGVSPIRQPPPVEEYLSCSGASPICSRPERGRGRSPGSRPGPTATSPTFGLLGRPRRRRPGRPGVSVEHRSPSRWTSAPARPTRPAAGGPSARSTSIGTPPCSGACPAGEDIRGWLYHAEGGDYEAAWRPPDAGQPAAGGDGPGLLPALRDGLQPRRSSTRRSASTRSSASSATWPSSGAGPSTRRRLPPPDACWSSGAGPSGLSAAYQLRAPGPSGGAARQRAPARAG